MYILMLYSWGVFRSFVIIFCHALFLYMCPHIWPLHALPIHGDIIFVSYFQYFYCYENVIQQQE